MEMDVKKVQNHLCKPIEAEEKLFDGLSGE